MKPVRIGKGNWQIYKRESEIIVGSDYSRYHTLLQIMIFLGWMTIFADRVVGKWRVSMRLGSARLLNVRF